MEQLKRQNLSEIIAGRIKHYIIDNQLKPGDRLPTEHQMAERFGVSRVSIREATKALGFLGILRSAPRRGLTVGEVDMRRVTEYLGFHFVLTDYPKRQLLETRIIIETGALPHVAERMALEPELYDRLSAMTERLHDAHDLEQRIAGDIAFHRELLNSSGVGPLVAFNDLLEIFFSRFRQSVEQAAWDDGVRGHQQIVDALRSGDVASAREALSSHLGYHKAHL
jgi:GntR family transcriptional repressor for pyruvate dehydrogenase complex